MRRRRGARKPDASPAWKASASGSPGRGADRASASDRRRRQTIACVVTTKRVFMWTAGTFGLRGWTISEIPDAQKRGSLCGALDLAREFRSEASEDRRDMHARLLEDASAAASPCDPPPPGAPEWSTRDHGVAREAAGRRASGAKGPAPRPPASRSAAMMRALQALEPGAAARWRASSVACVILSLPRRARSGATPRQAPAPPRPPR